MSSIKKGDLVWVTGRCGRGEKMVYPDRLALIVDTPESRPELTQFYQVLVSGKLRSAMRFQLKPAGEDDQ